MARSKQPARRSFLDIKAEGAAKAATLFELEVVVVKASPTGGEPVRFNGTASSEIEARSKARALVHQFTSVSNTVKVRDNLVGTSYVYLAPGGIVAYVNIAEVSK